MAELEAVSALKFSEWAKKPCEQTLRHGLHADFQHRCGFHVQEQPCEPSLRVCSHGRGCVWNFHKRLHAKTAPFCAVHAVDKLHLYVANLCHGCHIKFLTQKPCQETTGPFFVFRAADLKTTLANLNSNEWLRNVNSYRRGIRCKFSAESASIPCR